MASPKPRPARLKLLEGTRTGRDSGGRKVLPTPAFVRLPPEPPEWLPAVAAAEWARVVPELQRLQLVKPIEAAGLSAYCMAWQRFVDASALLADEGLLQTGPQGRTRHPAVTIVEAASKELRAWAAEWGLTASSESRLGPQTREVDDDNPFA